MLIRQKILRALFSSMIRFDWFLEILAVWFVRQIRQLNDNTGQTKKNVLVFMHNRFMGELEVFKSAKDISRIDMPYDLLGGLYRQFYGSEDIWVNWSAPHMRISQMGYRSFLRKFVPKVYRRLDIKLVISPGFAYTSLIDWGAVTKELGYAYIVLNREGYAGSNDQRAGISKFGKDGRQFEGTKLVLQSNEHWEVLTESGLINKSNSLALGSARMDSFVKEAMSVGKKFDCEKQDRWVTMFSFGIGTGFLNTNNWPQDNPENYISEMCRLSHVAVARFAIENQDINVMIKAKWDGIWKESIFGFLESDGIAIEDVPNLHFSSTTNVHSLIRMSRVVIGYGSTTLLESAIYGRPVIVPRFGELLDERFQDMILFPDLADCFDHVYSPEELKETIAYRWRNPTISESVMVSRRNAFERYVSPLDGKAADRILVLIKKYCN